MVHFWAVVFGIIISTALGTHSWTVLTLRTFNRHKDREL